MLSAPSDNTLLGAASDGPYPMLENARGKDLSKRWALSYCEWGNVPEKTWNEFHAKDATIAKRDSTSLSFSRIAFQELA
jgi:hypothetical protein